MSRTSARCPSWCSISTEVSPGEGYVDWGAYFEVCRGLGDGAALIVEHLHGDAVEPAIAATVELAQRHGIALE